MTQKAMWHVGQHPYFTPLDLNLDAPNFQATVQITEHNSYIFLPTKQINYSYIYN
jgi:hypothetical protein